MFHTILYQPLLNLLIWLYNVIPGQDLGFAIIGISLLIKLVLWPLSRASLKSQKALQDLQPKLNELKEQYKDEKEKLSKAMMELYKQEKVNPLSSCLPLIIQLPILWALYRVLSDGMNISSLVNLYPFVARPEFINLNFLGFINLAEPQLVMAIIAGILQFFQTKMLAAKRPPKPVRRESGAKDEDMMAQMNQTMLYFMPVMTVVIGASLPGGLTLYWIIMNLFAIVQQALAFKKKKEGEVVLK